MSSGIYQIVNKCNGHRYIGSACNLNKRESDHFSALRSGNHHNIHLQYAYDKYGIDAFEFQVLEVVKQPVALILLEQYYLDDYDPEYNFALVATGGGRYHSDETKLKIKRAREGKKLTDEAKAKVSRAQKGKEVSFETRNKLGKAAKGRKLSPEACQMISLKLKGKLKPNRLFSDDEIRRIRALLKEGLYAIVIANLFGVSRQLIDAIKQGKCYRGIE